MSTPGNLPAPEGTIYTAADGVFSSPGRPDVPEPGYSPEIAQFRTVQEPSDDQSVSSRRVE